MIYINEDLVTQEIDPIKIKKAVKSYLHRENLVLIDKCGESLDEKEISELLFNSAGDIYLKAIDTSVLLNEFGKELNLYIKRVEQYIEDIRDSEDFSTVNSSFVQVIESILEFSKVETFLSKNLIDELAIKDLTEKAFIQVEKGNNEYILDLMEYELLPVLHNFLSEINEEM
ncbi:hypothetical protein [Peribacillus asahii]|uniref:hypothetical protein n=1 Tax=Peribacillus asahii TaxID=228899 RepID=UPI0038166E9B